MHSQSADRIWIPKKCKTVAKTCAQSYTFYWTMTGPQCCHCAPLLLLSVWKWKRKQIVKKNRRQSNKTRAILFYYGKPCKNSQLPIGVFVLDKFNRNCSNFSSWLDNFGGARTPTHTPLARETVSLFACVCFFLHLLSHLLFCFSPVFATVVVLLLAQVL